MKKFSVKHYAERTADLCFFTRFEGEVLQDSDDSKFHIHDGKPHANAISGSRSKRQVYIRIYAVLVLLTEPGSTTVDEKVNETEKSQEFQV